MAGKKVGSDGQIRKTTAEWAADTDTYPEGMRLMDTETGSVRVSKGTTYALAWTPTAGSGSAWGDITGTLSAQTDLQSALDDKLDTADLAPTATFSTNTNTAQDPGQDTFRFNNATIGSVTEIALSDVVGGVDKGDLNSRCAGILQLRTVGTTETIEFLITGIVHTSWTRYTVTYLKGTLPANGTVLAVRFLATNDATPSVTTALAAKADALPTYVALLTQSGTSAPSANVLTNTTGITFTWAYVAEGVYRASVSTPLNATKTELGAAGTFGGNDITIIVDTEEEVGSLIVTTYAGGVPADGSLSNSTVKAIIHP